MNTRNVMYVVALSGLLAVILGAFGAHGLRPLLDERTMHAYETAVLYHFLHTLVLLAMAFHDSRGSRYFRWSLGFFMAGLVGFSGSLYAIAFAKAAGMNMSWLGPVTPIGGLLFMSGWLCLALYARERNNG